MTKDIEEDVISYDDAKSMYEIGIVKPAKYYWRVLFMEGKDLPETADLVAFYQKRADDVVLSKKKVSDLVRYYPAYSNEELVYMLPNGENDMDENATFVRITKGKVRYLFEWVKDGELKYKEQAPLQYGLIQIIKYIQLNQ